VIPSVELSPALVADLAATGAAAGVLALLLAGLALLRVSQLGRRHGSQRREGTRRPVPGTPMDLRAPTDALSSGLGRGGAIRNVAVVRYDAFSDIGGQLSFSAALLDDGGDGLVLTVINGRSETRTYAKDIRDGTSVHRLSDDEVGAIDQALGRTRQP
jgi:hypothetical protein